MEHGTASTAYGLDGALAARAKPGLPTDVKVYAVTDDDEALKVTWMPVDTDNGGVITRYTVERTPSNDRDSWNDPNTGEDIDTIYIDDIADLTKMQTYTITGLNTSAHYTVRVRAWNDHGPSPPAWYKLNARYGAQGASEESGDIDIIAGAQEATPTCEPGVEDCAETHERVIQVRALPDAPPTYVPQNEDIDEAQLFTQESLMVYFDSPADTHGDTIDKWGNKRIRLSEVEILEEEEEFFLYELQQLPSAEAKSLFEFMEDQGRVFCKEEPAGHCCLAGPERALLWSRGNFDHGLATSPRRLAQRRAALHRL